MVGLNSANQIASCNYLLDHVSEKLHMHITLSILERFIMQCPLVPTLEGPLLNSKVSLGNIV